MTYLAYSLIGLSNPSVNSPAPQAPNDPPDPIHPVPIGSEYEGGYYAGQYSINGDGITTHLLIVSPKSVEQRSGANVKIQNTSSDVPGTVSPIDGLNNTDALLATGGSPAASYSRGLSTGGYTDWYIPAFYELELLYYNLKPPTSQNWTNDFGLNSGGNPYSIPPRSGLYSRTIPTQTSVSIFQQNGSQAISNTAVDSGVLSSSQNPLAATRTGVLTFYPGAFGQPYSGQHSYDLNSFAGSDKTNTSGLCLRPVRKVAKPPLGSAFTNITWSTITRPNSAQPIDGIALPDGKIFLVPSFIDNTLQVSVNNQNFSTLTLPTPTISQPVASIARRNYDGRLVAMGRVGTTAWVSTDNGSNWTAYSTGLTMPTGFNPGPNPIQVRYVGGVFKALISGASGDTNSIIAYSSDGITWSTGIFNPSITTTGFSVPATNSLQTRMLAADLNGGTRYYYSNESTPVNEFLSRAPGISVGNCGREGVKWAADLGFLLQPRASNFLLIEPNIAGFDLQTIKSTHNSNSGGEGIAVVDATDTYRPSVVLIGPWGQTNTWRVNYNLAGGGAWQDTIMPVSLGGYSSMFGANGKFCVTSWNTSAVYIGTLS